MAKKTKSYDELVHKIDEFFTLKIVVKEDANFEWKETYFYLSDAKRAIELIKDSPLVLSAVIIKKTLYEKTEEVKDEME